MPLTFYPHPDDIKGSLSERVEILTEAAERYKAVILDQGDTERYAMPREQTSAFNWEEIARVLRELRGMPELSAVDKIQKADLLTKLAEIYETLRAAKMPKLEAVRLALINEANQLRQTAGHV